MQLIYENLCVNLSIDVYVNVQSNFIKMQYINVKTYENYVYMILHVGDRYMPTFNKNFKTIIYIFVGVTMICLHVYIIRKTLMVMISYN